MLYLRESILAADDGARLGHVLKARLHLPQGFISHCKFIPGGILVNGLSAQVDTPVHEGDVVAVRIDDVGGGNPFRPVDTELVRVLWEDEYLAVVAKSAEIAVHGADVDGHPTVANWAAYRWGAEQAFHPVSRLDRGTSGLMCLARCGLIHDRLRSALHTERYERVYLALCEGEMPIGAGAVEAPIARADAQGTRRAVCRDGKASVTEYECLHSGGGISLLRLRLRTGRTHQIRVHMASIGHPLCGDRLYGGGTELPGPALHSAYLAFDHPIDGRRLNFAEEPPAAFLALLSEKTCYSRENVLKYIYPF